MMKTEPSNWRPTASFHHLQERAQIIKTIRDFFYDRNLLEVETPVLAHTSATDPYIHSFKLDNSLYLQTSPEYFMKRLLAAGSGSIYQITKAFRTEEQGQKHNPEFTMLEWYHLDFNHHQLMDEMDELLQTVLQCKKAQRISYAELFQNYCQIDPHCTTVEELMSACEKLHINLQNTADLADINTGLDLLMSHCIEPYLGIEQPTFVYDYPTSQAALARIRPGNPSVAERFEVYINGIELANGFHELAAEQEQRARFKEDLQQRSQLGYPVIPIDEHLLAALKHGLPACAGVALGIDRLVMIATGAKKISEVLAFPFTRI